MHKFELGQTVYIMENNQVVKHEINRITITQLPNKNHTFHDKYYYYNMVGKFIEMSERDMFTSKEELIIKKFKVGE